MYLYSEREKDRMSSVLFNESVSCQDFIALVVNQGNVSMEQWWNYTKRGNQNTWRRGSYASTTSATTHLTWG